MDDDEDGGDRAEYDASAREQWGGKAEKAEKQVFSEGEDEEDVTFVSELYSFLKKIVSFFTMMCSCPLVVTRTDVYGEFPIIIICFFVVDSI